MRRRQCIHARIPALDEFAARGVAEQAEVRRRQAQNLLAHVGWHIKPTVLCLRCDVFRGRCRSKATKGDCCTPLVVAMRLRDQTDAQCKVRESNKDED